MPTFYFSLLYIAISLIQKHKSGSEYNSFLKWYEFFLDLLSKQRAKSRLCNELLTRVNPVKEYFCIFRFLITYQGTKDLLTIALSNSAFYWYINQWVKWRKDNIVRRKLRFLYDLWHLYHWNGVILPFHVEVYDSSKCMHILEWGTMKIAGFVKILTKWSNDTIF